ncbi:MAG: glycosyltransferase [Parabacteroides sp.]|nr:glycosyltransferase [Parabacteroides sp.]
MRIGLFTDTYYPEINGVANSVYQLKKELEDRGHEVFVFTVSNPIVKEKESHVYRMKSVACPLLKERRMSYAGFRHWFQLIGDLKLHVIHTQTEFTVGHIGRKAAKKLHIPLIHTYHTIYEDYTHYLKIPGNEKLKGMVRTISRVCCDHADEVIVPTDKVKKLLITYGVKKQIQVQPTGIQLYKFSLVDLEKVQQIKAQYNIETNHHVLVSIGRLSKEKSLNEIIEFMSKVIKTDGLVRLLIVGDGPEREHLEEQVRDKNLEAYVYFTGEVDWKEIQNYYAVGDVFTCASTSETQGLTYAEALACGKPLLVREDECLSSFLQSGTNGYFYRDETEFINCYQILFQNEQCRKMSFDAMESVNKLSSKTFGKNIEQIYFRLTKQAQMQRKGDELYEQIHSVAG